jgi:hypothetical protein
MFQLRRYWKGRTIHLGTTICRRSAADFEGVPLFDRALLRRPLTQVYFSSTTGVSSHAPTPDRIPISLRYVYLGACRVWLMLKSRPISAVLHYICQAAIPGWEIYDLWTVSARSNVVARHLLTSAFL